MGGLGRYARKDLNEKNCWLYFLTENQHIFIATHKDLGVGGWGLKNPYGVRMNPLEIIGRSLSLTIHLGS